MVQKIYSKMHLVSCTTTHHDVTDSVDLGMVKNTITWISWEWSNTFLRNKKTLNLCLRWHILRSYYFVVEVNFKQFPCRFWWKATNFLTIPGHFFFFFVWLPDLKLSFQRNILKCFQLVFHLMTFHNVTYKWKFI